MSVYVDTATNSFGRMVMCHMIADTPAELRAMAETIGVQIRWFQSKASAPHFDIAKSKRALAMQSGAIELDRRQFVEKFKAIRQTWPRDENGWSLRVVP